MAKRFTDTDKWKKPFIRGLQGPYKLLWMYILDDCDHAGIWQVDFEVARIRIGDSSLDYDTALRLFDSRIIVIEKFKWFIPDFIDFQYGKLSRSNRAHLSVIQILTKYKILSDKGLVSPLEGDKDKDKDKERDKDKSIITLGSDKNQPVVKIKSKYLHEPSYLIYGEQGYKQLMEEEQLQVPKQEVPFLKKFMVEKNGAIFDSKSYLINSFKNFINQQFK